MKLIYLHGPPAAGKLTIAKELEKYSYCKILHNHLTIDVGKSIFEFGSEPFWDLVHELRIISIKHAAKNRVSALVYTSAYSHPHDLKRFQNIQSTCVENNIEILPFFLKTSINNLKTRVASPHRVDMKKISSQEKLESVLNEFNFIPLPLKNVISIDTDTLSSSDAALEIIKIAKIPSKY
jgi:hypothetical protein